MKALNGALLPRVVIAYIYWLARQCELGARLLRVLDNYHLTVKA